MTYDILFAGPASKDENIDVTGQKIIEAGGAAYFGSFSARAVGGEVFVALKVHPEDREIIDAYALDREHLCVLPSGKTTNMRNTYLTEDRERRITECLAQADPVCPEDIPDLDAKVCHVAGLLYGDYPKEIFPFLADRGAVSADMQAFVRHNENGQSVYHDWSDKRECMPCITYLKADAAEAEILTGLSDRREAAKALHALGAKEIFISFNSEMLVYDGSSYHSCPVKARNLSGRTGRGDTVFAAYLVKRVNGASVEEALLYATAAVSMKMEQPGPLRCTIADIEQYLSDFYR